MERKSTTGILKESIQKILITSDDKLSISEIREKLDLQNISNYRQGHLAGALHQIADLPEFESPERGYYQYTGQQKLPVNSSCISEQLLTLYKNTAEKAGDILNTVNIADISEDEIKDVLALRTVILKTKELLDEISQCNI